MYCDGLFYSTKCRITLSLIQPTYTPYGLAMGRYSRVRIAYLSGHKIRILRGVGIIILNVILAATRTQTMQL